MLKQARKKTEDEVAKQNHRIRFFLLFGPFDNFERHHNENKGGWKNPEKVSSCYRVKINCQLNLPYDIALEQDAAHGFFINHVDLANLSQLQRARGASEEKAHDNENGVIQNADVEKLGRDG